MSAQCEVRPAGSLDNGRAVARLLSRGSEPVELRIRQVLVKGKYENQLYIKYT
jgi:hypothetical protein